MDLSSTIKQVGIVLVIMLVIDGFYLAFTSKPFVQMIERIQHLSVSVRWTGAAISYLCMALLLVLFAIQRKSTLIEAFLLGLLSYGIYDSVNYALFTKWNGWIAIQDSIWGGILFVLTKIVYERFF
jgi:uncharacterized membrane protein